MAFLSQGCVTSTVQNPLASRVKIRKSLRGCALSEKTIEGQSWFFGSKHNELQDLKNKAANQEIFEIYIIEEGNGWVVAKELDCSEFSGE